MNTRLILERV